VSPASCCVASPTAQLMANACAVSASASTATPVGHVRCRHAPASALVAADASTASANALPATRGQTALGASVREVASAQTTGSVTRSRVCVSATAAGGALAVRVAAAPTAATATANAWTARATAHQGGSARRVTCAHVPTAARLTVLACHRVCVPASTAGMATIAPTRAMSSASSANRQPESRGAVSRGRG